MSDNNSIESSNHHKINRLIFALGIISILVMIGTVIWLFWNIKKQILGTQFFIFLGILLPLIILTIGLYFELKGKFSSRQSFYFGLGSFILIVFVAIAAIKFNFNLQMEKLATFKLIVFAIVFFYAGLGCVLAYCTLKTKLRPSQGKIIPTKLFAIFAFILIIANGAIIGVLNTRFYTDTIQSGTGYTEGPWAILNTANTASGATIIWLTEEKNSSILMYGTDPNNLNLTYTDLNQKNLHKAVLYDLLPNTTYYYQIPEDFITNHTTNLFHFKTGSQDSTNLRFAVFGDKQPTSIPLMESNGFVADGLIAGGYEFICQVGDLASSGESMEDWHNTFQSLSRIGATSPLMMAMGNHDYSGIQGSNNWRQLFPYDFVSPTEASYYSYNYGNAHFVMLDNFERFYRMSESQINWLNQDVLTAKSEGKWVFVFMHLSIFTTATSDFMDGLQSQLVPLFDRTGVDAVFYGHDHHYEHYNFTYGANNLLYSKDDAPTGKSIQYFCTGTGGANLEVNYSIFTRGERTYTVPRYNTEVQKYQDITYIKHDWNRSRYVENPAFSINYTQYDESGQHDGKYYYHAPDLESYSSYTDDYGFTYGELSYNFMDVTINGDTCVIRAIYPNGQVLSGPNGNYLQEYTIHKK